MTPGVRSWLIAAAQWCLEPLLAPVLVAAALLARLRPRPLDVGLGPEPIVSHAYHKQALALAGYRAETYAGQVWHITADFDRLFLYPRGDVRALLRPASMFLYAVFRFRALYFYFNGGPLMATRLLWRLEPMLLRLADVRTVVMPYGSDVQELSRSPNLAFKHAMTRDYPNLRSERGKVARRIDLWTARADHVVSGCEWVDYMYFWHTLTLLHFPIDPTPWEEAGTVRPPGADAGAPLRILHAPNHRAVKGTEHFVRAVDELRAEGIAVELVLLEGVPNHQVRAAMAEADVIADQLVVGWYAMFALEGMAMGRPVLCHLRRDLETFYVNAGLVEPDEIPIVNVTPSTLKDEIRILACDRAKVLEIGRRGQGFVRRRHSVEAMAPIFSGVNRHIGVESASVKQ